MSYADILRADLILDEGTRSKPYKDIFNNLTIGVGRNLTADGVSQDEIDLMLANDIGQAEAIAEQLFTGFWSLSDNRKAALVNLAFNMGEHTLGTFTTFIGLVNAGEWDKAADDLLQTAYSRQVGARAKRRADQLRNG